VSSYSDLPGRLAKRISTNAQGCWLVRGPTSAGYGQVQIAGRKLYAHRVAYELFVGPIPEDLEIHHACGMKACCNPDHLRVVTHAENAQLAWTLGERQPPHRTHCRNGHALTADNTYVRPRDRTRICRECRNVRRRVPDGYGPRKVVTTCRPTQT
jgi:hypothetical protein